MNIINLLRKTEIYFIIALFLLNIYCAFALRGENIVNSTHLMMAVVMMIFINDKLLDKIEKNNK